MTFQTQLALANLPLNLILLSNGSIAFVRVVSPFKAVFDTPEDPAEISAEFHNDEFTIGKETFQWNVMYDYKQYEGMKGWLKQQRLSEPTFQHHHF